MQAQTMARCRKCGSRLAPLERGWCNRFPCRKAARDDAEARAKLMPTNELASRARNAIVAKAKRAMCDPVDFFELVLRDEATNHHVVVPPHQRVLLSFITHPTHDKTVCILPVGTGKTTTCTGVGLWMLANNPRLRGAFISATQAQAKKPLMLMRQLLEASPELRLINEKLIPSRRSSEPWSDTKITVDRPIGIKDPSFAALGIESEEIQGWRLDVAIVDDLLNSENTATPEQREATYQRFFGQVANRMEPKATSRLCLINTTWHPEDYVNRLSKHWPTIRMSVTGDIWISNADPAWSPEDLYVVRTEGKTEHCRLAAHHPDPKKVIPLWRERYSLEEIERQRQKYAHAPGMFNRFFLSDSLDDSTALCKREFIERCKKKARDELIFGLVPTYNGDWFTFTGVDLAWTPDKKGGETSFFTFAVRGGDYIILDIESGHWDALSIIGKLFSKIEQFRSYAAIENNATQEMLIQVARSMGKELPIRSHNTTQQGKAHPWQGVIGIFFEMATGRWRIPNDEEGNCPEAVQHFVDACLHYSPTRHTADVLMASYVARSLAMSLGYMNAEPEGPKGGPGQTAMSQEQRALRR